MTWLAHILGIDNLSGRWYGFWSGFGSDLGEIGIIGGLIHMARTRTCHVKGCWRIGRHPHGPYRVCAKHHPGVPDTTTAAAVDGHRADP